jgi:DNA-binding transcriptional ArsR family regulator
MVTIMSHSILESRLIESPEQATALMNPLRADIVSRLVEPASAAEVARNIGETAQRINYHLKMLEKLGLVRKVGTRQVRNLVEVLYQAVAKTFILAESLSLSAEMIERIKDHGSLAQLVTSADQLKRDAVELMEQADQQQVPSASLYFQIGLPQEDVRQAFVDDYIAMVKKLVDKYGAPHDGSSIYKVMLAVYPKPESDKEEKQL